MLIPETRQLQSLDGYPVPVPRAMRKLRYATNAEQAAYMRMRQEQNRGTCRSNPGERLFAEYLRRYDLRLNRQMVWGYRVFDFWSHNLGVAVEVDGASHTDPEYDAYRDEYNLRRSAILVLRVEAGNRSDADHACKLLAEADESWSDRRERFGLVGGGKKGRRQLVSAPKG